MKLHQKAQISKLLIPELRFSLQILSMPLLDLKDHIEQELSSNPVLEENMPDNISSAKSGTTLTEPQEILKGLSNQPDTYYNTITLDGTNDHNESYDSSIVQKATLYDILLRQLMITFTNDDDLRIGLEIIGYIDHNGYLTRTTSEISNDLNVSIDKTETVLSFIHKFEPYGVGARSLKECLLIQYNYLEQKNCTMREIIELYLDDIAKKKYSYIAKKLNISLDDLTPIIQRILRLDPKPGRNFSPEETHRIIPDVIIEQNNDSLSVHLNNEYVPHLKINKAYKDMLKNPNLDPHTKEFLLTKIRNAIELMRSLSRRKSTLHNVVSLIIEKQQEAILNDLSLLKPLTFGTIADALGIHESTVCRVVMNKYAKTPHGLIAIKDFFPSGISDDTGTDVSSVYIKNCIMEAIREENKTKPLSDKAIVSHLQHTYNLKVARRTITKYREELKILSSVYRRER